jgi:hypothetical protein
MLSEPPVFESRQYRRIFGSHEDERLRQLVEEYGSRDWRWIARHMPNRTPRQCRERYNTYLCPEVNVSPWTKEEDRMLLEKFTELGSRWADIRPFFKSRTVNNIKNRWHRLARQSRIEGEGGSSDIDEASPVNRLAVFEIANLLNKPAVF